MRERKYNILELREYRTNWADVHVDLLDDEQKDIYIKRKQAVDMYIDDIPLNRIMNLTNIARQKVPVLVGKCIKINPQTGRQFGYAGLLPYKQLKDSMDIPIKNSQSKSRGAFSQLLLKHPILSEFISDTYFKNSKTILEKNITIGNLYYKFLEKCRDVGIQDYEYPFNTSDRARRSFYKYIKNLELSNANNSMRRADKNVRQKFYSTGIGRSMRPVPLAPFSVVQLDGHKIDMLYTVDVINKHGELVRMPAMRMWLIAVIDVSTRTILGYSLTTNENYNQTDVLRAIRNAIIPKTPIEFSLAGLKYPDNYGFPSLAIPAIAWAMPNTIMLDNAKSHLAQNVIEKLCSQLYCSMNFGSVATPETRGIVERVFKTLEENGYHRTVSTTGSNINDVRRNNAEKDSVTYQITYNDIAQLTEYFIALYNNSPHSSLDNQTPLECMQRRIIEAGMQPCIADSAMKRKVYELTNITEIKTIRGSIKNGKRPYITYKGTEYRNDILSQSMGLIGQKLIIDINPDDISTIRGFFEDGTELGILTAVGEWGRRSHSLKTREEAMKLANYNKQKNNPFYAPLTELENELNERAANERRARTKAARIRAEQGKELNGTISDIPKNIVSMPDSPYLTNSYTTISEEDAIRKKRENYTSEEMEAIMNAGSLEEAYRQGLI